MSVEEDSFIVLDETPSMLQFSMLDSPVCNSTDIDDKISTIQENDIVEIEANNTNGCTTKKSTLAQSFLLGDINSDKLKVINGNILFKFILRLLPSIELFPQPVQFRQHS